MAEQPTSTERIHTAGDHLLDQVERLLHEGNVRRIVIKQEEHTIAEFPLTVGVVGAMLAPMLAAIGALAAVLAHCTIEVERVAQHTTTTRDEADPAGDWPDEPPPDVDEIRN